MTDNIYNIAVLLTCFNRCILTQRCLKSVLEARDNFNSTGKKIDLHFYITDDACTDSTADMAMSILPPTELTIIKSEGNAFWAGGMRLAWEEAYKRHREWSFYLLINDDVVFAKDAFTDLLSTHNYAVDKYGIGGVYTGFISDTDNCDKIIYGAKTYKKLFLSKTYDMYPTSRPQPCSFTNANILLVSTNVVDSIGLLYKDYIHGGADWDYGIRANMANLPVLTTCGICGNSVNDHDNNQQEKNKVIKMSYIQRKQFLLRPNRGYYDAFVFFKKYNKTKYYVMKVAFILNLFVPRFFYFLNEHRP